MREVGKGTRATSVGDSHSQENVGLPSNLLEEVLLIGPAEVIDRSVAQWMTSLRNQLAVTNLLPHRETLQ